MIRRVNASTLCSTTGEKIKKLKNPTDYPNFSSACYINIRFLFLGLI